MIVSARTRRLALGSLPLALTLAAALLTPAARAGSPTPTDQAVIGQPAPVVTHYRTGMVDGVSVFYREAGPADAPVVLLLHGFPTSSHMFRNLIPILGDRYHLIAPDYPGFGDSAAPDHTKFAYTFGHYADIVDALMQKLGAHSYAMYVMDYGAPVGYRLALKHPERVTALVVQNGNAYAEGLGAFWDPIRAYWADDSSTRRAEFPGGAGNHEVPVHRWHERRVAYRSGQLAARPGAAGPAWQPRHPTRSVSRQPITPHGMRAGFITTAYRNGVPDEEIMGHTRHRSLPTMRGYIRHGKLGKENPAGKLGL